VRYEGRTDPVVRDIATTAPHGIRMLYVVVEDEAILSFGAADGGFDPPRGEMSGLAKLIEGAENTLLNTLSFLEGA
jgi:hypothetical protein